MPGIGLFRSSATPKTRTVEIDARRAEVRLVRGDGFGGRVVQETCAFQDVERAEHDGCHLRIWVPCSRQLVDLSVPDCDALNEIVRTLKSHGKLA